jgi:GT2 family glycosyltransferase
MKIGVGIITCNRPEFFRECFNSLSKEKVDEIVVVNDGKPLPFDLAFGHEIENKTNLGVGKSKNKAMQYLLDKGCDYIFIIEDDVIIGDNNIFKKYIDACKYTGIQHFNFGPGTPFNRLQQVGNYDLHNRHLLENESPPNPRVVIDYGNDVKLSFYQHVAGVFSFYSKQILEKVGVMDEDFHNAWEHVDHTYKIIKEKAHPPFWWFADIVNSEKMIKMQPKAIENSETAKNQDEWFENIRKGREIYKSKHGIYPNEAPDTTKELFLKTLKEIKNNG